MTLTTRKFTLLVLLLIGLVAALIAGPVSTIPRSGGQVSTVLGQQPDGAEAVADLLRVHSGSARGVVVTRWDGRDYIVNPGTLQTIVQRFRPPSGYVAYWQYMGNELRTYKCSGWCYPGDDVLVLNVRLP